jgi:hypothetical protein
MMFEIGVISIVVLAVGYWVTLWLMGRRDDVLHGDFVHGEEGAVASAFADQPFPSRPPFPPKPQVPAKPAVARPPVGKPPVAEPFVPKPSVAKPSVAKPSVAKPSGGKPSIVKSVSAPALPVRSPAPTLSERSDTLQMLLASIKRDLKDASQL